MAEDRDAPLAGERVLVVEDEMFVAQDIAYGVQDAGGAVIGPVPTVEEAMELMEEGPTGAILDVNLLDGDVTPVLERLVRLGVPAVVNTGTARPWEMESEFPSVPVFTKPTDPEVLADALRQAVEARRK